MSGWGCEKGSAPLGGTRASEVNHEITTQQSPGIAHAAASPALVPACLVPELRSPQDSLGQHRQVPAWQGIHPGIISLISLAVLSYERCCTMTRTAEPDTTNYRKAWAAIILSWTYSLLWTVPPLLGWSSYGPEGAGITCSVNWHSRDANNASYIICLFIFCLVIPFAIIVYSYGKLLCAVRQAFRRAVKPQSKQKHFSEITSLTLKLNVIGDLDNPLMVI
ncbi:hypothetical protein EK904_013011 [Melospiza melodia maxima]|nr:hypothetical protein EK904_013011 [Melospiza melodia maxima]